MSLKIKRFKGITAIFLCLVILLVGVNLGSAWSNPFNSGLVAYWNMSNTTSTNYPDIATFNYNGTVQGNILWANGKSGSAVKNFSSITMASGAFINITNTSLNSLGNNFSVFFWFMTDNNGSFLNNHELIANSRIDGWAVGFPQGRLAFYHQQGTVDLVCPTLIKNMTWYNLGMTMNASEYVKLWVNGSVCTEGDFAHLYYDGTGAGYIGTTGTHLGENATIDEIGIWNRVLTNDEISSLYNGGNGMFYSTSPYFEHSQVYNATTYEGFQESFILNVGYTSSFWNSISAELHYNNTAYPSTIIGLENNISFVKLGVSVPSVTTQTNITFWWQVTLTNSTGVYLLNSTFNNQTISKSGLINISSVACPVGLSKSFYFDFKDEQTLGYVAMNNISYNIVYGFAGNNFLYSSYGSFDSVNNFSICINTTPPSFMVSYGEIQYSTNGYMPKRFYIFPGTRMTNITVNNTLSNLPISTTTTTFLFTAQTSALSPYTNSYLTLLRWYPSLNQYAIVDMGKTDGVGQTVLHVELNDVDYRIGIYDSSGNLVKLLSSIRLTCQVAPCTYIATVIPTVQDLTIWNNIKVNLSFNSVTKVFTFIWNDPSQQTQTMNLTVYKDLGTSSLIICSTIGTGYTGIINCDVSSYSGRLRAEAYRTSSPASPISQLIEDIRETFAGVSGGNGKVMGLFIGLLILIVFALIGVFSPVIVVILGIISLLPLYLLGNINWIAMVGFGVLGGIILHFLGRIT